MKKTVNLTGRKIAAIALSAVLLVGGSVAGTMAYLTSQDTVTNTFTVGKVEIKLDEAAANFDGTLIKDAARVKENTYHLLPGHPYAKDPMVTVLDGSESAYVKMVVTVTESAALDEIFKAFPEGTGILTIFEGYDASNWILKSNTVANDARTYEFWYKEAVAAPNGDVALDALFDRIVVPGSLTNDELESIDGMTITVVAHAIQSDGFATPDAAWAVYTPASA